MRTALIIEDDEFAMNVLSAGLKRCGFAVVRAWDAIRAREICREAKQALYLIVCDVKLPDLSGPAVMLETVQLQPSAPILFTSGTPLPGWSTGDLERLGELERRTRCVFLPKPFRISALVEAVHAALCGRNRRPLVAA